MTSKDNLNPEPTQLDNVSGERITISYKYVERPDGVYYLWKLPNDKEWREKLTPYKQSPIVQYLFVSQAEFDNYYLETLSNQQSAGGDNLPMSDLTNKEN